jgi:hypothetical protein
MKMRPTCFWLASLFAALFQVSSAQDTSNVPCNEVHAIARISSANSLAVLAKAKPNAASSYRAQIVLAARSFELRPADKSAAVLLLNLLPQDDGQHMILMTLGDSLCDEETVAEMFSLSRIRDRLARDFAKAVLLAPDKLPSYVSYASTSVQDPHSDYAVQMQTVCRAKHPEFVKAVEGLPTDKREWFVGHVLNPEDCHALALPEAE